MSATKIEVGYGARAASPRAVEALRIRYVNRCVQTRGDAPAPPPVSSEALVTVRSWKSVCHYWIIRELQPGGTSYAKVKSPGAADWLIMQILDETLGHPAVTYVAGPSRAHLACLRMPLRLIRERRPNETITQSRQRPKHLHYETITK